MKKSYKILLLVGLFGLLIFVPKQVHAQATDAYTANITADGSSDVLVNGQQTNEDYVVNGDTVNVTFNNNAGSQILVCAKDSSSQSIASGSSANFPVTINAEAELTVILTSGNCNNGSGNPGNLYIEGATGNLSCSIVSSKDWNITGEYSYVPQSMYLYKGSAYATDIQASNGGGGYYFNASVSEEFSGQASAATYYLYDGTSNSDEIIGQATCPAIQVATSPSPSSPTPSSTSSSNPNTTSTPTSSSPSKSTPTTSVNSQEATSPTINNTSKKVADNNTGLFLSGGLILLLLVSLILLDFMNIWTKPKEMVLRAWNKAKRIKVSRHNGDRGSLLKRRKKE